MSRKKLDITGHRSGRLTAVSDAGKRNGLSYWNCKCDCGLERAVYFGDFRRGKTLSCGCLNQEKRTTHGLAHSKVYGIWENVHQRCGNPKAPNYRFYGGRGIKVCERWNSFENFFQDMGHPPSEKHTLDRKNNEGDYEPGNCRWATRAEQARNKSSNRWVTSNETTLTLEDWAKKLGRSPTGLSYRLARMPLEEALTPRT